MNKNSVDEDKNPSDEGYPLEQIKATFWATFDGAGELWFPSKERGEEGLQTEVQWQRFLRLLTERVQGVEK